MANFWNTFEHSVDKDYFTIHSCKVVHPENKDLKTALLVQSTFSQRFRVIAGSQLRYEGIHRDHVTALVAMLEKGLCEENKQYTDAELNSILCSLGE